MCVCMSCMHACVCVCVCMCALIAVQVVVVVVVFFVVVVVVVVSVVVLVVVILFFHNLKTKGKSSRKIASLDHYLQGSKDIGQSLTIGIVTVHGQSLQRNLLTDR